VQRDGKGPLFKKRPQGIGMALSCRFLTTDQQDSHFKRQPDLQMSRNHPTSGTYFSANMAGLASETMFHHVIKKNLT
jgi:hypothetical protein